MINIYFFQGFLQIFPSPEPVILNYGGTTQSTRQRFLGRALLKSTAKWPKKNDFSCILPRAEDKTRFDMAGVFTTTWVIKCTH